jgi:hypothetical protein
MCRAVYSAMVTGDKIRLEAWKRRQAAMLGDDQQLRPLTLTQRSKYAQLLSVTPRVRRTRNWGGVTPCTATRPTLGSGSATTVWDGVR